MKKTTSGFTIVELLIVIVVIAILAAITIVAYNGIQARAHTSTVQSELRSLAQLIEIHRAETGAYPNNNQLLAFNFKASKSSYQTAGIGHNLSYCYSSGFQHYMVIARSKSDAVFYISYQNSSPRSYSGTWRNDTNTMCASVDPDFVVASNMRGYAPDDTSTGPWRAWVGGN